MKTILGISVDRRLLTTVLLVMLFAVIASRNITRSYAGLHGYAEAHAAWLARAHLEYGLGYTHGFGTFAVGNPPRDNPVRYPGTPPGGHPFRYLNHPPLPMLLDAAAMVVFGVNEWALRLTALLIYALSIPLLLRLLRALFDESTAVLATLLFVLFPITGYFYSTCWYYWNLPLVILAWWNYLALIGALRGVSAKPRHQWMLCVLLFLLIQHNWVGLFYAAAIGTHYVGHCLYKRQFPDRRLLLILIFTPLVSLIVDFLVLLAPDGWNYHRLISLYQSRSTVVVSVPGRTATNWFLSQWIYLKANFTLPVIVLVLGYIVSSLLVGIVLLYERSQGQSNRWKNTRPFPYVWLFVMPGVLNVVVFTELFFDHQFQYIPFSIGVAIMAALAILRLRDFLMNKSNFLANIVVTIVMVVVVGSCVQGVNWYYESRQFSPEVIDMFKRLNREIPPDKFLLSYNSYYYQDHPYKPAFYRPEIAWSLDRSIVIATTAAEVDHAAADKQFSFYLVEVPDAPMALVEDLKTRYPYELFKGNDYHAFPPFIGYEPDRFLFDLRHPL